MRKKTAIALMLLIASFLFAHQRIVNANPGADLIAESITLYPSAPVDGDSVVIYVTVKNQGDTNITTDFWVPIWIDEVYTTSVKVTEDLSPGESTAPDVITATWVCSPGDHDFKAKADGGYNDYWGWHEENLVAEDDEFNNEKTVSVYIAYPDLIVDDLFLEPSQANDGETVQIRAIIKNIGSNETKRDFWVAFFVDDSYIGATKVTQNLAPNETTPYPSCPTMSWSLTPGEHEYKVKADGGYNDYWGWHEVNVVQESNEVNNELEKTLKVGYSDLIIVEAHWAPQYPKDGETITFYATVKNNGLNETIRDFYVTFLRDEDVYVGASHVTADLGQGENLTVSLTWVATPGNHEIKVEADGGYNDYWGWHEVNVVAEHSEDNNIKTENMSNCDSSIILSHSDGYAGMQIIINGTGFKPNCQVTILWDALNSSVTTFSNDDGEILTQFTIPNTYLGIHDISATDGEDTAPGVNFELRQARVSMPVLYDPGDVDTDGAFIVDCSNATSELGDVTKYEFQYSLSPVFTLPTTKIRTESRLVLSNLGNGTYYFRVRAWDEDHGLYSYWSNTESITVLVFSQVVLTVRVSDNGVPIPSANVTVRFEDGTLVASKLTNQSGYTTFTLTPGTYNIASQTAGYSINQTITSDVLIVFDPLAKIPEFQTALSMLIVTMVSAAFAVLVTKKRRKNF